MNDYEKRTWREFQSHGLLWFVNSIIHVFGWAIVIVVNDFNNIVEVYPARTKNRGFPEKNNTNNYKKLTEYMVDNSQKLLEDFDNKGEEK